VFAEHEDFSYDYDREKISGFGHNEITLKDFTEMVDQPEQRIKVVKVHGNLSSYFEAQMFLNKNALKMMNSLKAEQV
jgi:hypothetical protein